jgi:hypothetical protein
MLGDDPRVNGWSTRMVMSAGAQAIHGFIASIRKTWSAFGSSVAVRCLQWRPSVARSGQSW